MRANAPPKNFSLACWWLTYRLPVEYEDVSAYVERAAKQSGMSFAAFTVCQGLFPKTWQRVLAKRAVRLAFLRERGEYPPDGWAPLPGDGRALNVPREAQKRQFSAFAKRIAQYGH
jgi:hypothetical protein